MRAPVRLLSGISHAVHHHPYAADVAVAVTVYLATLITTVASLPPGSAHLNAIAASLGAAACGALVFRRRRPFAVLVVSGVAAEFYLLHFHGHDGTLVLAAPLIALYTVADLTGRRRGLAAGGVAVLVLALLHLVLRPYSWAGAENLALAALGALAVAAGDASRTRRAYLAEVEERARRAEHDRDQQTRRRLAEERLRIARDLHDTIGHHLALINVQAGVTAYVLDDQPAEVIDALANIRRASRSALDELRDTIGLLRDPGEPSTPTEPTLGLAGLAGLTGAFRRSGLVLDAAVTGSAGRLAPAADLTAYRVVQESLTNVCKHAPGARARLRLEYRPDELRITVDDDGPGAPGAAATPAGYGIAGAREPAGHGIAGMRERTAAVGGRLEAGARPGGGFRVRATLPLEPAGGRDGGGR